ncbi:hypothetical protein ASF43_17700 [Pseudorhodoferax sp. Leaf267]|nr:hypothetical protein ASF43_17700 [Pseudorhodoferax sp. Leaf267]
MLAAIVWLYLGTNALRVVSYFPQIHAVWRCRDGARSVSLLTWASWSISHVFAVLYSTQVVHDLPLLLISLINLVGCSAVTGIALRRRLQWKRALAAAYAGLAPVPTGYETR